MLYSIIVPVYNRPEEVNELLESLKTQTFKDFEILIIEDGSSYSCEQVVNKYREDLDIKYYFKKNSGPGTTRNYGAERSNGDYLIILDSDCIIPSHYLETINSTLAVEDLDAFGGADSAHISFSLTQKAINYSMTSFFTTGGIRGGKKKMDKFYPRSFNMGIKKSVYLKLGGFSKMRFGEDIDFSIRIFEAGYNCKYISGAWVYHKRRTNLKRFYKQVFNSGIARINLYKRYPNSLKIVHLLPSFFTLYSLLSIILALFFSPLFLIPLLIYTVLVFIDSTKKNHSFKIGFLSILATYIQLIGYGCGFILAFWKRCILRKSEFAAFLNSFYK